MYAYGSQIQEKESLYFGPDPSLQELCAVTVEVPPLPTNLATKGTTSNYQPQIIRCRELIFTEPDIIATPLLGQERKVQIIMQQTLFKTGRLQARFNKMGVKAEKPMRVTPVDFKSCLLYTLLARMAPAWNKVGDYLIQGRDAISNPNKMNTVVLDINVTEGEMYLTLRANTVRLPPAKLQDLDICRPVINEFQSYRPNGTISEYNIGRKWCHILPSMKKGQVVKVLHKIPEDSPFKTYKDIKRYWKNTYGYRLPESDEGMLYYQVYFKLIGEVLFTYPECCIRPRDAVRLSGVDPRPIMSAFLADLGTRVPAVCGRKMVFESQAKYTQPGLLDLSQITDNGPNITSEAPAAYNRMRQRPPPVSETSWLPSGHQENISGSKPATGHLPSGHQENMSGARLTSSAHQNTSGTRPTAGHLGSAYLGNTSGARPTIGHPGSGHQKSTSVTRPTMGHRGPAPFSQSGSIPSLTQSQYPSSQADTDLDCGVIGPTQTRQVPRFKPSFARKLMSAATTSAEKGNKAHPGARKVPVFSATKGSGVQPPKQDFTSFGKSLSQKFKGSSLVQSQTSQRNTPIAHVASASEQQVPSFGEANNQEKLATVVVSKRAPKTLNSHQKPATPKLLPGKAQNQTPQSSVWNSGGMNDSGYHSIGTPQSVSKGKPSSGQKAPTPVKWSQDLFTVPGDDDLDFITISDSPHRNLMKTPKGLSFPANRSIVTPGGGYSKPSLGIRRPQTPLTPRGGYAKQSPSVLGPPPPLLTPRGEYCGWSPGILGPSTPLLTPIGTPGSLKRKTKGLDGESTPKKPRSKPKIQEGANLEVLASNNQLSKVNSVTMLAWLRERGVACKTKDRKVELEEKVRQFLNMKDGLLIEQ